MPDPEPFVLIRLRPGEVEAEVVAALQARVALPEGVEIVVDDDATGWNAPSNGRNSWPTSEPPLPSLPRMAMGYIADTAKHVAAGRPKAAPAVQAARLAVCREGAGLPPEQTTDGRCDHYRPSDGRCGGEGGCGCFVAPKAERLGARCPLGRWPL